MNPALQPDRLDGEDPGVAQALRSQQVRSHASNLPWAIGGSSSVALLFTALQWGAVPAFPLLGWLAAVLLVLALRSVVGLLHRRAPASAEADRRWLLRYRIGFAVHGLVWGLASQLPTGQADPMQQALLIIVLAAITSANFAITAFDLRAALCFGVPALGLMSLQLFQRGTAIEHALGWATLGSLGFLSATARRANQIVRSYVALRVAEARQAGALRSSEELLERTGAIAGIGGWELDRHSGRLRLTAQASRIHGLAPGAGRVLADLLACYPPDQRGRVEAAFAAALQHGTAFDLELPLAAAADGQPWLRLIGQARPGQISGVVQDITQRRSTEQALAAQHHLLSLIVQTTGEGFWFIDQQAITTDANPAMCGILGHPREALIGRSIFDFVDAENAAIFQRQIARRAQGLAGAYELSLTRADGSQIACINHATPVVDSSGQRIGSVGMWTDISERKRAEEALRATGARLREQSQALALTLESIDQGIVSLDADGRVAVHNRKVLELLDLPDDLIGPQTTFDEVLAFQVRRGDLDGTGAQPDTDGAGLPLTGGPAAAPAVYLRRTRSGGMIEVRTRRLPDGSSVRTYADVTAYLTAQQALRDSEAELRAMLDAFPGFIGVVDPDLRYTYVNQRLAGLMDSTPAALIGQTLREVLGEARAAQAQQAVERVLPGQPVTRESEYPATAQRAHTVLQVTHATGAEAADGRRRAYAFAIDISAHKATEAALIAARDEAERANRAKSQFLSGMSHELRTPMNAILGFGQLLLSDADHPLAPHQRGQMQQILRGARHLLNLINEVLDLAVVETGRLHVALAPVALPGLLDECLGLLQPLAAEHGVALPALDMADAGAVLLADRTRLKQVLLNLLSNAIKYNRPGGRVGLDWRSDGATVCITVSDDGPGLSPAQCDRLFQPFERLDAGASTVEGTGLGLALSRRLVQAMDGSIGLDSTPGRGSRFWVRLPLSRTAPEDAPPPVAAGAAALPPRRRVLYIEDNPVNLLLMEAMLARVDTLQLISAALPEIGLDRARSERPDLILLDIQLPGIDGYEVLRRLRADPATRAIPVIAVSANAMATDIEKGLAAGFAQYLAKPVEMAQLLDAVQQALAPA